MTDEKKRHGLGANDHPSLSARLDREVRDRLLETPLQSAMAGSAEHPLSIPLYEDVRMMQGMEGLVWSGLPLSAKIVGIGESVGDELVEEPAVTGDVVADPAKPLTVYVSKGSGERITLTFPGCAREPKSSEATVKAQAVFRALWGRAEGEVVTVIAAETEAGGLAITEERCPPVGGMFAHLREAAARVACSRAGLVFKDGVCA